MLCGFLLAHLKAIPRNSAKVHLVVGFFLNVKVHLGFDVVDSICSLFEAMLKKKVLGFRLAFYDNVILIESIMCH